MHDNGLMSYYRNLKNKQGYLKAGDAGFKFTTDKSYQEYMKTPSGIYFAKRGQKDKIDAEILLSQIYKNAGFVSPTYMPVLNSLGARMVVSEDIKTPTSVEALSVVEKIKDANPTTLNPHFNLFSEKVGVKTLEEHFTPEVLTQMIDMYGFDVASKNYDRNLLNFFLSKTEQDGKVDGLQVFDYGQSGCAYTGIVSGIQDESKIPYRNLFASGADRNAGSMLNQLKTNPVVLSYETPSALAEKIGSVDVVATAQDVKQSIGYEINPGYVDFVASSFDKFANDLVK